MPTNGRSDKEIIAALLARLDDLEPFERIERAVQLGDLFRHGVADAAAVRRLAMVQLRDEGMKVVDIARRLGVARGSVHKAIFEETGDAKHHWYFREWDA